MPRELDEKDIAILKKLAPECGDLTCSGSGHMFHSILPPVSNHFAEDNNDFIELHADGLPFLGQNAHHPKASVIDTQPLTDSLLARK